MESNRRKTFTEDIFAEENEKWSWPLGRTVQPLGTNMSITNVSNNYDVHASEVKISSSSPSSDEELIYKGDSSTNSTKRSFKKHEFSSASEENGGSLSPLNRERLLPSIYDDDAQSGSPSGVFEKKDLAFQSSFKKDFNSLGGKLFDLKALGSRDESAPLNSDKDLLRDLEEENRSSSSLKVISPIPDSKDSLMQVSPVNKDSCRSSSRDDRRVRSRSRSRGRREKSPRNSRASQDRSRHSRSRRSRSPRTRRSRSPRSRRSRSPRPRRSHSRESRRDRRRSYERRHRSRRSISRDRYRRRRYSRSRSRDRSRGSGGRKPGSLPLSSCGGAMTPQMALQQTMAAMSAKAQAMTGIALPKYYNPAAVNPLKYAEQVQKRKLLWQSKEKAEEQPKNSVWDKLTFDQDQDGKMTAKFRKLMGIKSESSGESPESEAKESAVLQKQAELFRDLDQQYEMARVTTHTQRGVGLGYSGTTLYPPIQK